MFMVSYKVSHILIHHVLWEQLKLNFAVANWITMAAIFAMCGNWECHGNIGYLESQLKTILCAGITENQYKLHSLWQLNIPLSEHKMCQ